jgi:L-lactate utilization protein LutB
MKISFDDAKQIVNKVTQGGGGNNFTPLEIELAKMVVKYRQTISKLADEKAKMFDNLYKVYNAIHSTEFAADLMHKHADVLAGNSKAHFAQAVKLDNELKDFINNGTSENKDS